MARAGAVTFFALLILLSGCGKSSTSPSSSPFGHDPLPTASRNWGNGEGYLGPHTEGEAIPLRPDRRLTLGRMRNAAKACFEDLRAGLNQQLLQGTWEGPAATDEGSVQLEAVGLGPSILRYLSNWHATSDFPLPFFDYGAHLSYPVALPAQEFRSVVPPLAIELQRKEQGIPIQASTLKLTTGLPQLLYQIDEGSDDAFDRYATLPIDYVEVRVPPVHGVAIPMEGESGDIEINTVAFEECLISETSELDQ